MSLSGQAVLLNKIVPFDGTFESLTLVGRSNTFLLLFVSWALETAPLSPWPYEDVLSRMTSSLVVLVP